MKRGRPRAHLSRDVRIVRQFYLIRHRCGSTRAEACARLANKFETSMKVKDPYACIWALVHDARNDPLFYAALPAILRFRLSPRGKAIPRPRGPGRPRAEVWFDDPAKIAAISAKALDGWIEENPPLT